MVEGGVEWLYFLLFYRVKEGVVIGVKLVP